MRLMDWAESKNILHPNQSGFRKLRSTQDNIFKIIESCKQSLQAKEKCGIVLFDIEKAFDKAPHKGILKTLEVLKCPPILGLWLCAFLSLRKFVVEINGSLSEPKDIQTGVPQGSPLSPLLFSLFINDIGKCLEKYDIYFALFADDLTIWKNHKELSVIQTELQKATNAVNNFFKKSGLTINIRKCEYSIFTLKDCNARIKLKIGQVPIEYNKNPKILGIYFDTKLKFTFHFDEIKKQLASKVNLLRILSYKSNSINPQKLLTIYKSLILSKIQYSMLPFMVASRKIKNEIQVIQNKCLKTLLNAPLQTNTKLLHDTLKINFIEQRLANLTCNYIYKAKRSNPTVTEIIDYHNIKPINEKRSTRSILDRINMQTLQPIFTTVQF